MTGLVLGVVREDAIPEVLFDGGVTVGGFLPVAEVFGFVVVDGDGTSDSSVAETEVVGSEPADDEGFGSVGAGAGRH